MLKPPSHGAKACRATAATSGRSVRAAEAIIAAVSSPKPPFHLVLGRVAYEQVSSKLKNFSKRIRRFGGNCR